MSCCVKFIFGDLLISHFSIDKLENQLAVKSEYSN